MEYLKQKQTRFDAHGHWNTAHEVELTLKDALALLALMQAQHPDAFTPGGKWACGKADSSKLPHELRSTAAVLMKAANADP